MSTVAYLLGAQAAPSRGEALIRPRSVWKGRSLNFGAQKEDPGRSAYPTHPTQIPGTATFWTRCGDAAALGG